MDTNLYAFIKDTRGANSERVSIYLVVLSSSGKVLEIHNLSKLSRHRLIAGIEGTKLFINYVVGTENLCPSILGAFNQGLIDISKFI